MNSSIERHLRRIEEQIAMTQRTSCGECRGTDFRVVVGGTEAPRREDHPCPTCLKVPKQIVWIAEGEDGPQ